MRKKKKTARFLRVLKDGSLWETVVDAENVPHSTKVAWVNPAYKLDDLTKMVALAYDSLRPQTN